MVELHCGWMWELFDVACPIRRAGFIGVADCFVIWQPGFTQGNDWEVACS